MFDLQTLSSFLDQMEADHPTVVQNIEVVRDNGILLDESYHVPKRFMLHLNNLLRSLLFFIEHSLKNTPPWLHDAMVAFKTENEAQFDKLKHLRNVSTHHNLIFPKESFVSGLFRLTSPTEFRLKLGIGDHGAPGEYAWDLAFRNTEDIFHTILSFHSLTFMDLEHSALGECLGISRRWYFKVKFNVNSTNYDEVLDVYQLCSEFSAALLDRVCNAYAAHKGIHFAQGFSRKLAEHNHVNTLLEIDLYPSLFTEWWDGKFEPLNIGVRRAHMEGLAARGSDDLHKWVYGHLSLDADSYRKSLERFAALDADVIVKEEVFEDFYSFVLINHWHVKSAFGGDMLKLPVTPSDVMRLQRLGRTFMEEVRKGGAVKAAKEELNAHIQKMLATIVPGPAN